MSHKLLVLNGPRLAGYGDNDGNDFKGATLETIRDECTKLCAKLGIALDFRQTENQGEMHHWIANDGKDFDGIVLSPLGFRGSAPEYKPAVQALTSLGKPVVEVYINNVFAEGAEAMEQVHESSSDTGFVCGLGVDSYLVGIKSIAHKLKAGVAP